MKTIRRQELRTNELSQQIDQISDYVKKNAAIVTTAIAIAALVAGGIFWYVQHDRSQLADGWAVLHGPDINKDPVAAVDRCEAVARRNLSPALTTAAWMKVGEIAMMELELKPAGGDAGKNWPQTAQQGYEQVLASNGGAIARGSAMIALGVLAENQSDIAKARQWYQKVLDDAQLAGSPLVLQAKYRQAGLEDWSKPVKFPPPPPPPAPTTMPTSGPATSGPAPLSISPAPPETSTPPPVRLIPTTQPAK